MAALRCTHCDDVVSDHQPGVSSVIVDGQTYHPGCAPRTWTEYVQTCIACGEWFRASQEAIDSAREGGGLIESDAEIAAGFEFCLQCCDGHTFPGEKEGLHANH